MNQEKKMASMNTMNTNEDNQSNELPDSKIPWWDNHYEDVYSEEVEDGYPYDMGTKVQE